LCFYEYRGRIRLIFGKREEVTKDSPPEDEREDLKENKTYYNISYNMDVLEKKLFFIYC
jgi:hypothetical protein